MGANQMPITPDAASKDELKVDEIKQEKPSVAIKKENQWFDVGIIKATSCVVSHYHLPSEATATNGEVREVRMHYLFAF